MILLASRFRNTLSRISTGNISVKLGAEWGVVESGEDMSDSYPTRAVCTEHYILCEQRISIYTKQARR